VRRLLVITLLFATVAVRGAVTFVSPLEGAQAIGPMVLEVTTDAPQVDRVDFFVDGALAGVARQQPYRIAFDFGTSLTARTVSAKVWSGGFNSSQSANITTAALTVNDTLDIDLVEVPLRVRSTRALAAGDLRVRENGVEQQVRELCLHRRPVALDERWQARSGLARGAVRAAPAPHR
jgi:hypothetical protein